MNLEKNNIKKDIIIFEGLDRAGKSTHIELFKKNFTDIQYFHCTGPDPYFNNTQVERNIYQTSTYYNQFKDVRDYHNLHNNRYYNF